MFSGGPAAHSRSLWTPSTTPSVSSPDWDATGTAISATTPAATRRKPTVTSDAASAGCHPRERRNRVGGQVSVVRSRPTMSGQTTDHIRSSSQRATASATRISSNSAETRADVRNAARVFAGLSMSGMTLTLWGAPVRHVVAVSSGSAVTHTRPGVAQQPATRAQYVGCGTRRHHPAGMILGGTSGGEA